MDETFPASHQAGSDTDTETEKEEDGAHIQAIADSLLNESPEILENTDLETLINILKSENPDILKNTDLETLMSILKNETDPGSETFNGTPVLTPEDLATADFASLFPSIQENILQSIGNISGKIMIFYYFRCCCC